MYFFQSVNADAAAAAAARTERAFNWIYRGNGNKPGLNQVKLQI